MYLQRPKSRLFDMRTTLFLLGAAWVIFYMADRIYFRGIGYGAITDALRAIRTSAGF